MPRLLATATFFAICFPVSYTIADDAIPKTVKESIDNCLIGEFETEMSLGGEVSSGTYTASWLPGKNSVLVKATIVGEDGVEHSNAIIGWQADTKTLVSHGFDPHGYWTIRYTEIKPAMWTGAWKGYFDGKMQGSKSVFKKSGDGWEYRDETNELELHYKAVRKN